VPTGRPVTARQRARVIELHGQGLARNEIARKTKLGAGTVTKIIKDAGLSFDRADTQAATAAKVIDNKARRAALSERLLVIAGQQLDRIDQPGLVYAFGGKDNDYNEHWQDRPPPADVRNLMTAAAVAIDKHAVLEKLDTDSGAAGARSMLGELGAALQIAAGQMNGTTEGGEG